MGIPGGSFHLISWVGLTFSKHFQSIMLILPFNNLNSSVQIGSIIVINQVKLGGILHYKVNKSLVIWQTYRPHLQIEQQKKIHSVMKLQLSSVKG